MKKERKFKALFATIKSCFLWISSQKTTTKSPRCRWTWTLDEGGGSVEWALAPYSMIKHLDRVSFDSRRYIFVCPRLGSLCTLPIVPKPCWCVSHSPLPKKKYKFTTILNRLDIITACKLITVKFQSAVKILHQIYKSYESTNMHVYEINNTNNYHIIKINLFYLISHQDSPSLNNSTSLHINVYLLAPLIWIGLGLWPLSWVLLEERLLGERE